MSLNASDRFNEAIVETQAAFYEAKEFRKKNPKTMGISPAQQARVDFLEAVNAERQW